MCKGIGNTYKYDHQMWPYPSPNTNFTIPTRFDTSIQNQRNSAYGASAGANDEASYGLDTSIQTQCSSESYASSGANDVSSAGLYQSMSTIVIRIHRIMIIHIHMRHLRKNAIPTLLMIKSPPQPYQDRLHCFHL